MNRYKDEAARPYSARKVAEPRPQTQGRAEALAKRDLGPEAAKVMVVGPPGCSGCFSTSVSSGSRRKH